jgi:hypothetical protein
METHFNRRLLDRVDESFVQRLRNRRETHFHTVSHLNGGSVFRQTGDVDDVQVSLLREKHIVEAIRLQFLPLR